MAKSKELESGVKRMEREIYPVYIKVKGDIGKGTIKGTRRSNEMVDSFGAITISISVDSEDYPKQEVRESVRETALKAIEYFR